LLRENLPRFGHAAHIRRVASPSFLQSCSLALLLASGCGSSQYPGIDDPMPPSSEIERADAKARQAANAKPDPLPPGTLRRADVESVVDAGLGRFLAHVTLEPRVSAGKFQGWTIMALEPPEMWRDVDLKLGDVVTRVNGMPIEREMEAYDAFQAVRQAPTLEVSLLRQNQPRTLKYTIAGAPSPSLPQAPPSSAPPAAAAPKKG
jgi:hypothetical protein